jgi:hypothetical protein
MVWGAVEVTNDFSPESLFLGTSGKSLTPIRVRLRRLPRENLVAGQR